MTFSNIDLSRHATVAVLRLSKPADPSNALGISLVRELQNAVRQACREPAVKVLVVTGSRRAFSAGVDLAEMDAAQADDMVALLRAGQSLVRQIMDLEIITLAAINGLALGGGLELALACDIRWAHTRAVLGLPEAKLGVIPGWGGLSLLRRAVPESLCIEMVAGGECLSARRAYDAGLVSRIFDDRDFDAAVVSTAKELADRSERVVKDIKAWLKRERPAIDFAVGDQAFMPLWNRRVRSARPPAIACENWSVQS
jgi:enoyl-CoA hydratase/carnithine racemase